MEKTFSKIVRFIREVYNEPSDHIPLHAPVFAGNEKKYMEECIDSTFVSSAGKFVDRFEEEIAKYTGAKKAVSCVNGTSALYLALLQVGVDPGTEVITQPLTFVATANAIEHCRAEPVFLDVDMDTMGLSPGALKTWLDESTIQEFSNSTDNTVTINKYSGRRISACLPMHTFGHPCRIDEIVEICNVCNIPVVEDAAESTGSFYKGQHTGTFGRLGILSFNGNKTITTGGGGMILSNDEELGKHIKHLTTQAKVNHPWEMVHDHIGYNYRMPNINAALGCAQLENLERFLQMKRALAGKYRDFFADREEIFFNEPENAKSNYWLNTIICKSREFRDKFLKETNARGIMTRPVWRLMNHLEMYRDCLHDRLENAEYLAERLANLPSSPVL